MSDQITAKKPVSRTRNTLYLFIYGLLAGTSTPLLLSRCAGSGGCTSCGGACTLAVGIVPLLLFIALRDKAAGLFRRFSSAVVRNTTGE